MDDFAAGPVPSWGLGAIKCTRHRSAEDLSASMEALDLSAHSHH